MRTKKEIEKMLDDHKKDMNSVDYEHYFMEYNKGEKTTYEVIENVDIDSTEFNIGFEQGYTYALKAVLNK